MVSPPQIITKTINHSLPLLAVSLETDYVWMALVVRSGSATDPQGENGLAHLTEHLSVASAREFPAHGLWQHLRSNCGGLSAQTCVDATTFLVWLPTDEWQQALAALAAIVLSSTFSESILESERRVVLNELPLTGLPEGSFSEMAACYFGSHPYSLPVEGTRASVRRLTVAALNRFRRKHYVCHNCVLIVVGACDADLVCQSAEALFAAMPLGQPAVGAPPFQRPAGGPLIRSLQAPQKGGLLSLWWPMADDPSALLLANILRMPGGPLQQMLVEQGFPSLSGTVEVWLARSARTLLVEVQAKEQPTLGRHELLKYLRNLAGALPETSIIEAAQRQLLMHYQENMQDGRWVCEQLVDCVVRRDEWILHEAAISGAASFLQQRWVSLLDLSRGLITCAWPEQARRQSLAWPAACPQDNVTSLDKKAIVGSGNLLFLETTPSVPNRVKMTNGATLLVHRSHVPRFTLTVGFINGGDALPAVLAAGGGEGWNRLVRALAIRSLSLRSGCTPDYAWLQMTGPTDQFGVGLEYLIRIVDTSPDCRFAQIAEAWPEQPQGQYKNNLILSPPLRLMAEIFPNYQYRNIPNQLITWERMLHCWNDSFIGCQSVWAITGDVTDRDVTSMAKEIETLRHGEIIRGEQAFLTKPQKKLILVNASSSAAFIAWSLPPEASNIGDLEILRWLLSGYLFRTLRAGHPGIYRGGALYRIWQDGSAFGLYALARPWHVLTCLRKMQSTVAQIHAEGFDTQKVAAAKAALSAAEDELCANQDAWGLELIAREVSSGPLELATIRYQKSSPSTIQYSLQQYLQLEEAVTLVIWPGWHKILKTLSNSINLKLHLEKFKSS